MSEEVKEVTIATSGKIIQTPCGPIIHGLEDVLVKTTTISDIDGKNGILWYRGYRIDDLAKYSTFEEVAYLILYGKLPNRKELDDFKSLLASYRELPNEVYSIVTTMGKVKAHPMLALEAGVAALGAFDENPSDYSKEANLRRAIKLTSALPIMIAAHYRASRSLDIVKPRKDLSHAANFLYMMFGKEPDETSTKAIDLYLVLHIDHEVPASTFATLVAISTWTDLYSSNSPQVLLH
jgi:citrate synthase (EC 2.3.3.1)